MGLVLLGNILQGIFQEEVLESQMGPYPTACRLLPDYAIETKSWHKVIAAYSTYRLESVGEGNCLDVILEVL
jgi:hypothetical protein